jgi:hypothetical protein
VACEKAGLPCPAGYECYCRPCVRAFEVEVYEKSQEETKIHTAGNHEIGCEKMSLCGSVEQTRTITFRMSDNLEREDPEVSAIIHMNEESRVLEVSKVPNATARYEISFSQDTVGVGILEIFFDGQQIPESPFRVQVVDRNCEIDFPGKGRSPVRS